jgi:glutamine synthetase adenylyltransferase
VEGRITVEQVADDLSALADSVLRVTARWCWSRLRNRHRDVPQFGIIGYGKLGGKELGYGSDLDIVFVFDDDDDAPPEAYAAFVRKLINWLTVKTGEGDLFEIDTALRPNGNSGLLVTSFEAYANYQQQRGSNTAWTWEHQAMTRARFVLGSPPAGSALTPCARPSSPRPRRHEGAARRDRGHARARALRPPGAPACLTSSTARAAWWMPSLPCSTWCCRNLAPTPNWRQRGQHRPAANVPKIGADDGQLARFGVSNRNSR